MRIEDRVFKIVDLRSAKADTRGQQKADTLGIVGKYIKIDFEKQSLFGNLEIPLMDEHLNKLDVMNTSPLIGFQEPFGQPILETKNTLYILQDMTRELMVEASRAASHELENSNRDEEDLDTI